MRAGQSWIGVLWLRLQEPRVITALQTISYLVFSALGIVVLLDPPRSIEAPAGTTFTLVWGLFAALGGLAGVYGTPGGKWIIERPAIYLCGTAIMLYLGMVIYLQFTAAGNRWPQILALTLVLLSLARRFATIRKYDYEPGK